MAQPRPGQTRALPPCASNPVTAGALSIKQPFTRRQILLGLRSNLILLWNCLGQEQTGDEEYEEAPIETSHNGPESSPTRTKNETKQQGTTGSGLNIQQKDFQLAQAPDTLRILLWSVLQAM